MSRDRTIQEIRQYYRSCGDVYRRVWFGAHLPALHFGLSDDSDGYCHETALSSLEERLIEIAQIRTSEMVVDAGCGEGSSLRYLTTRLGCRVVGLNISLDQLASMRSHTPALWPRARVVCADYHEAPLAPRSFDVVWAIESLGHAYDRRAFILRARSLLRAGGRLVVAEAFMAEESARSKDEKRALTSVRKGWRLFSLLSETDCRDLLEQDGFRIRCMSDVTNEVLPSARFLSQKCKYALLKSENREGISTDERARDEKDNLKAGAELAGLLESGRLRYVIYCAEARA